MLSAPGRRFVAVAVAVIFLCACATEACAQCTLNGVASACVLNGPITVSSGYTAPPGTTTTASGAITINANAQFNAGSGQSTLLNLTANTTLGTSGGTSTLTLNSGDNNGRAIIQEATTGVTLTNNANIQGYGMIGNGGLALINYNIITASGSGQQLLINGTGGFTNDGVLEADAGATLNVTSQVTNFESNATQSAVESYYALGGTVQLSFLGTGGGEIKDNYNNLGLDGPGSAITDASGQSALSGLELNYGHLAVENGASLSLNSFYNKGYTIIGAGSDFDALAFNNEEGAAEVDGQMNLGEFYLTGAILTGAGQITVTDGLINYSATVAPGSDGAFGTLTINGAYEDEGTFDVVIGPTGSGLLVVNGNLLIGGPLVFSSYGTFSPPLGSSFDILNYTGSLSGAFTSLVPSNFYLAPGLHASIDYSHPGEILLDIDSGAWAAPEPATWVMLVFGTCALFVIHHRAKTARAAR